MCGRPQRILIVDDDPDILVNLSDILSDIGFEIETASDCFDALKRLGEITEDDAFDLCLLDFKMPGMDGVELLNRIRVKHPEMRAIMITAFAGDDGVQRALEAGTQKVLRKPVDVGLLLGTINEAVA